MASEKLSEDIILSGLLGLQSKFDAALADIEASIDRLYRLASMSKLRHESERRVQVLSLIHI